MGSRIKFRGEYQPYVVGERAYDPRPLKPTRGPRAKSVFANEAPDRMCSSCSRLIAVGWPCHVTRVGTSRHDRCP
jgi:hypothetical protein